MVYVKAEGYTYSSIDSYTSSSSYKRKGFTCNGEIQTFLYRIVAG